MICAQCGNGLIAHLFLGGHGTMTDKPTTDSLDAYDTATPYGVITVYPGSFSPQIKLVCNVPWVPHRLAFAEEQGVAWIDLRQSNVAEGGKQ